MVPVRTEKAFDTPAGCRHIQRALLSWGPAPGLGRDQNENSLISTAESISDRFGRSSGEFAFHTLVRITLLRVEIRRRRRAAKFSSPDGMNMQMAPVMGQ
jgi:hypothetical protein